MLRLLWGQRTSVSEAANLAPSAVKVHRKKKETKLVNAGYRKWEALTWTCFCLWFCAHGLATLFPPQRSSDRHGGQPHLHCPAPLPCWDHGLGDDRAGDLGAWIW